MDVPEDRFEDEWSEIVADLTSQGVGMVEPPPPPGSPPHTAEAGEGSKQSDTDSANQGQGRWWRVPPPPDPPPPQSRTPAPHWDEDEHFVPGPPPALPEGTPITRLAWLGVLGGPGVLLGSALTGFHLSFVVAAAAGLSFLAGFTTLVWLLPDHRDDQWDDGAQI